jgi:hypothetical protein
VAEGGGVVSIFYHPCDFVHKAFWDAVNFLDGANPPPEAWKPPPAKSPEEKESAFGVLEDYVRYMKSFPQVRFITASEAARLKLLRSADLREIVAGVGPEIGFQVRGDYALSRPHPQGLRWRGLRITGPPDPAARSRRSSWRSCAPTERTPFP